MVNSQEWLNKNFPLKERSQVITIFAVNKRLEGKLIIENFPNLESLQCGSNNNLTELELNNLPKLNYIHANHCQLTNIRFIDHFDQFLNLFEIHVLQFNNEF